MTIDSLKLKNFKSIAEADVQFVKGINLITGANGQGKTNLFKGIPYLTLGYTEKKTEKFIRWGADGFLAESVIFHDGMKLHIKSEFSKKKSSKLLTINDKDLYENSAATEKLASIFDPSLYKASMLSFQGENTLIQTTPAERREYLKKIYDLSFKAQIEQIDYEIGKLTSKTLKDLETERTVLINKSYPLKPQKSSVYSESERLLFEVRVKEIMNKISTIKLQASEYEAYLKSIETIDRNIANIRSKIMSETDRLEKSKALLDSYTTSLKELDESEIDRLRDSLDEFVKTNAKEIEQLETEASSIKLFRLSAFDDSNLESLKIKSFELSSALKIAKDSLLSIEAGLCPQCNRPFSSEDKKNYEETYTRLIKELEDVKVELEAEKLKKAEHEEKVKQNELKKEKLREIETKIRIKTNNFESNKTMLENKISSELSTLLSKKEYFANMIASTTENIVSIETSLEDFNSEYDLLVKERKSIPEKLAPTDNIDVLELEMTDLKSKIKEYDDVITYNAIIAKDNEQMMSQKRIDEKRLSEVQTEIDNIMKSLNILDNCKEVFKKQLPNYIISQTTESIEYGMNEFIDKVYDGRYRVKIAEQKDGIIVTYGDYDEDVYYASGFERDLFSSAYKHALNVVSGIDVFILDEPDAFADNENSESFYSILGGLQSIYSQLFIITHKKAIQSKLINEYNATAFMVEEGKVSRI